MNDRDVPRRGPTGFFLLDDLRHFDDFDINAFGRGGRSFRPPSLELLEDPRLTLRGLRV